MTSETVHWSEHLSGLLVAGVPPNEATQEVVALGVPADIASRAAESFVAHPLFGVAKTYWARLCSREWLLGVYADLAELRGEVDSLDVVESITPEDFKSRYYLRNRALLVRGAAIHWPAISLWGRDYLIAKCGGLPVQVMSGRQSAKTSHQNTSDQLKREMPFENYARLVFDGGPSNDYYVVSRNRFFDELGFHVLLDDVGQLLFVNTQSHQDDLSFWFGPSGTVTPLHFDARNNVIVQVVGRKKVRLYAPYFSEFMMQQMR